MSLTEKAWESINSTWYPYYPHDQGETLERIKASLRALQAMRIPIAAIDEIRSLISNIARHTLESSVCEGCGIHSDGTDECSKCGVRVEISRIDTCNGMCDECQEEDDEDDQI